MHDIDHQALIRVKKQLAPFYTPRRLLYWSDLVCSAAIGWSAFALSFLADAPVVVALALAVSALAHYRVLVFTHEIEHLPARAIPGFRVAWHVLFGMPFCVPHFMYRRVHSDHHNIHTYGTSRDPEYMPFVAAGSFKEPLMFAVLACGAPVGLFLRFFLLAPLSLVSKRLRLLVVQRASAFVLRLNYIRAAPSDTELRHWQVEEVTTSLFVWCIAASMYFDMLPTLALILRWYVVVLAFVLLLLLHDFTSAHRYESSGTQLTFEDQIHDSVNLEQARVSNLLLAPVGLNLHATHHLFPGLPYYALRTAHDLLMQESQTEGRPLQFYVASQWGNLATSVANIVLLTRASKKAGRNVARNAPSGFDSN